MNQEVIECIVEEIIYTNEDNGYTVLEAIYADESDYFTAVGFLPYISEGQYISLTGSWTEHSDYGTQFKVDSFEIIIPTDAENIYRYLASGVIEGIREKTAKKLVEAFGADTLDIIADDPERLATLKGISIDRAKRMSDSYKKLQSVQNLIMFLQKYNVSLSVALKVHEVFGSMAISIIEENPYALADSVSGVSFSTADSIAYSMGLPKDSILRINCGIKYILQNAAYQDGHTYLPKQLLIEDAAYKLGVTESCIEVSLAELSERNEIVNDIINGTETYFLKELYEQEMYIASRLSVMAKNPPKVVLSAVSTEARIEALSGEYTLAPEQRNAVITAASSSCMVLTGGPGTGKTTTVNTMIKVLEDLQLTVMLAAPTGRAAKRLSQVTCHEASTIHRMLCAEFVNGVHTFTHNETNPLKADVIIVDEVSMVDTPLMCSLLRAVKGGARIIFCGDSDQLPSIGPGSILKNIAESGAVPVIKLTKIFRQAEQSLIIMNAHSINKGEYPDLSSSENDFFCLRRSNAESVISTIKDLAVRRLPNAYNVDMISGIQVLSPTKRGDIGTLNLNKVLQQEYNPPSPDKYEHSCGNVIFREGDKVMQIKNNYDMVYTYLNGEDGTGIFNGDMGIIEHIYYESKYMTILFDEDKRVDYPFDGLDELDLAYAITVHKSQGSEFPVVVLVAGRFMPRLMTRNLLYTAVTRARDIVIIVGSETTVKYMVDNAYTKQRYTALSERLSYFAEMTDTQG